MPTRPQRPSETTLADLFTPFTDAIVQHRALPLREKNIVRATGGSGLIAICLYVLITTPGLIFSAWVVFAIWAGLLGFGALWAYVGIRASIGPRDIMAAFWSSCGILLFIGLMTFDAHFPADWYLMNFLLNIFYVGSTAGSATKLWLSVRGVPGAKLDDVRAQQAHGHARDATQDEAAAKLDERAASRQPREFRY